MLAFITFPSWSLIEIMIYFLIFLLGEALSLVDDNSPKSESINLACTPQTGPGSLDIYHVTSTTTIVHENFRRLFIETRFLIARNFFNIQRLYVIFWHNSDNDMNFAKWFLKMALRWYTTEQASWFSTATIQIDRYSITSQIARVAIITLQIGALSIAAVLQSRQSPRCSADCERFNVAGADGYR